MTEREKTNAVLRMQDYIHNNITNEITLDEVCKVFLYSKRHALRIFKELLYKTPFEYIRDLRLTIAQNKLLRNEDKIVDIAFDNGLTLMTDLLRLLAVVLELHQKTIVKEISQRIFHCQLL